MGQKNVLGRKGKIMEDKTNPNGTGAPAGENNGSSGTGEQKVLSFDEWLASNPEYQKEFDRRQTKGINTAVTKERDRLNALHNDQLNEAQKLARMNEDEKRQYMDQKREKELAEREAAITRRELAAEAKNTLIEKSLPVSLANLIDYTDANSVKKSIETLEKEWAPALETAVNDKLRGGKPPKDAGTEGQSSKEAATESVRKFMKRGY